MNDTDNQMMMRFAGGYKLYSNSDVTEGIHITPDGVARYMTNVTASFDDRSLVDKHYVDSVSEGGGGTSPWAVSGEHIYNSNAGFVGIGTSAPLAKLHVKDSSVLFSASGDIPGTPGNTPVSGAGKRMMWYPDKAAFRAGYVSGTNWDRDSIGNYSTAMGFGTKAKGAYSTALGNATTADGEFSFAAGSFNNATGEGSVAAGSHTIANGYVAFATGSGTMAGDFATALGFGCTADNYSIAAGNSCSATGDASTAFGMGALALGHFATAMGLVTRADGDGAFATGYATTASGSFSTAMGSKVSSNDKEGSFAIGDYSSPSTVHYNDADNQMMMRFAGGYKLYTNSSATQGVHITPGGVAKYMTNVTAGFDDRSLVDKHYVDSVSGGGGSSPWAISGEHIYNSNAGNVGIGTTAPLAKLHVKDSSVLFTAEGYTSFDPGPTPVTGEGRRMMWYPEKGAFRAGYVDGTQWNRDSIGYFSTACGENTLAYGNNSTAFGKSTSAVGFGCTALGYNTLANGYSTTAMGLNTIAGAYGSTAMGSGSIASGYYSVAMGKSDSASALSTVAIGTDTRASGNYATAIGNNTKATGYYTTALGNGTRAIGQGATALGDSTVATGDNAMAMGKKTTAPSYRETTLGSNNTGYIPISATEWQPEDRLLTVGNGNAAVASDAMVILKNGNTGFGTATPAARLHVEEGNVVFAAVGDAIADPGNTPASGAGRRMMWYAEKGAFRAGYAGGSQWDKDNIGNYSIALGEGTRASGLAATALGSNSIASGEYTTALGSLANASGANATAIGTFAAASGDYSTAMGNYVSTGERNGSFIIGDNTIAILSNDADNQMMMRFSGGYKLHTDGGSSVGAELQPNANSWSTISDVRRKENFAVVNGEDFLRKISKFNLTSWNYKGQDAGSLRHYGPMAQDFHAAFGRDRYGTIGNDTTINQADMEGVSFIAIQALVKRTEQLQKENDELKAKLAAYGDLSKRIETVEARLGAANADKLSKK